MKFDNGDRVQVVGFPSQRGTVLSVQLKMVVEEGLPKPVIRYSGEQPIYLVHFDWFPDAAATAPYFEDELMLADECKLCRGPKEAWQIFCGAACSAEWEAGERHR